MSKERKAAANKGFSLVELIIVIAIMAILGVVIAPQFTKYVERSRVSTDKQNVAAIVSALQVYYIDPDIAPENQIDDGDTITLKVGNATLTDLGSSANCTPETKAALENAGITSIGLKSSTWGDEVVIEADVTGGVLTVTATPSTILN